MEGPTPPSPTRSRPSVSYDGAPLDILTSSRALNPKVSFFPYQDAYALLSTLISISLSVFNYEGCRPGPAFFFFFVSTSRPLTRNDLNDVPATFFPPSPEELRCFEISLRLCPLARMRFGPVTDAATVHPLFDLPFPISRPFFPFPGTLAFSMKRPRIAHILPSPSRRTFPRPDAPEFFFRPSTHGTCRVPSIPRLITTATHSTFFSSSTRTRLVRASSFFSPKPVCLPPEIGQCPAVPYACLPYCLESVTTESSSLHLPPFSMTAVSF